MADGLVDTNVFIHAHATDPLSDECRRFLAALARGDIRARLEPLILHELSYALPRYAKQMRRDDVAAYLLMVLGWDGIQGEKDVLADAVERWRRTPGLSFADAYLAALATQQQCPVYTKNVRELSGQGVSVPEPLPRSADADSPSAPPP
jgi:predicted nucleic acid-binding protein